jgi:hypothetical protein
MRALGKAIKVAIGVVMTLMLVSITTPAQGQVSMGGGWSVGESRGTVQIKGTLLCADCSLDEARQVHPPNTHLYQLTHRQGQVMMRVSPILPGWSPLAGPRIWVRAEDREFAKLTSAENRFREVEVRGILSSSLTLDLSEVRVGEGREAEVELAVEGIGEGLLGLDPGRLHQELVHWQQERPTWPQR